MSKRPWMMPLVVGAAARLIYLIFFPQRMPHSDDQFYFEAAQSLAAGHGYGMGEPSVYWMPGMSILLLPLALVFGRALLPVRLLMMSLSIVTIVAAWKLAREWLGERVALWTAWTFALFPAFWFYSTAIFTENVAILLVVLALLWITELKGGFDLKKAIGIGLCWAGLLYVKPEFVFWPIFFGVAMLLWRQIALKTILVMGIVGALFLVPWTIRNEIQFHEFIPLKASGGYLLYWVSLDPPVESQEELTAEEAALQKTFDVPGKPGATGKNAAHAGIERLKQHPFRYLKLCFTRRLVHLFVGSQTEPANGIGLARSFGDLRASHENGKLAVKLMMFAMQGLICALGILGILLLAPNWIRLLFLGMAGTYIMLLGIPRYSMVLMPMMIPYGAALLEKIRPSPSLR